MIGFIIQLVIVLLQAIMIGFTHKVKYNKLVNPILIFVPLLIAQWVILRVGVADGYYYPSMLQDGEEIRGYFAAG